MSFIVVKLILFCQFLSFRGTEDILSPHGIPKDLLDRLIIVRMKPYTQQENIQIIKIRSQIEGLKIEDEALAELSSVAERASLRYL